nr:transcription factor Sox-1-like isoform X1 [Onthophagus taurus]
MEFQFPVIAKYEEAENIKIPRPANAFMLYANHNRKKLAQMYPLESNKEISKRLGTSWKELDNVEKLKYYDLAKKVDAEHKKKYPDYVYNPKEARIRKAMREASRERAMGITLPSPRGGTRRGNVGNNPWNFSGEDQMMMGPHGVRMMNSPMCTSPGFNSMSNTSNGGGFMPPIHYTKHLHPMSHHSSQNFVQNNSPRIPQQPEIWHPYEEMRSNSTGPYIISPPHQMHGYQQHLETTFRAKPKTEVDVFPNQEHHHQTIPSNCERQEIEKITMREPVFENKLDSIQPLETDGGENESYVGFGEGNFENKEETKPKKVNGTLNLTLQPAHSQKHSNNQSLLNLPEGSEAGTMVGNNCCNHACCSSHLNQNFFQNDYNFINPADVNDILLLENYNPNYSSYQDEGEVLNLCIRSDEQEK